MPGVCHVATKLPASQSSLYLWYRPKPNTPLPAYFANDGRRETTLHGNQLRCAHTKKETNPWWVVDLGIPLTVTGVLFTNRYVAGTIQY